VRGVAPRSATSASRSCSAIRPRRLTSSPGRRRSKFTASASAFAAALDVRERVGAQVRQPDSPAMTRITALQQLRRQGLASANVAKLTENSSIRLCLFVIFPAPQCCLRRRMI
jgi:hypothetical protein